MLTGRQARPSPANPRHLSNSQVGGRIPASNHHGVYGGRGGTGGTCNVISWRGHELPSLL